jgi:hypothetical protein
MLRIAIWRLRDIRKQKIENANGWEDWLRSSVDPDDADTVIGNVSIILQEPAHLIRELRKSIRRQHLEEGRLWNIMSSFNHMEKIIRHLGKTWMAVQWAQQFKSWMRSDWMDTGHDNRSSVAFAITEDTNGKTTKGRGRRSRSKRIQYQQSLMLQRCGFIGRKSRIEFRNTAYKEKGSVMLNRW